LNDLVEVIKKRIGMRAR